MTASDDVLSLPAEEGIREGLRAWRPGNAGGLARWVAAVLGAFGVYAMFLVLQGADPVAVLAAMADSAIGDAGSVADTLERATPLLFGALAVAVPARAGLFNIGGEGQLLIGAVAAAGTARLLGPDTAGAVALPAMALVGGLAGLGWALIAGVLRVTTSTNEAITTLLMNYIAGLILTWLVFGPWKDPDSLGQAYSTRLPDSQQLPSLAGGDLHTGVLVGLAVAAATWLLLRRTSWGFQLRVVGGNSEAARRAGLRVSRLQVAALAVGGLLAGLGGAMEITGVEERLRPEMMVGFGFIGFLASWLARHDPLKAVVAAVVLGGIAIGGNGLKVTAGLSGSAVNILMAVLLLAVLGWARRDTNAA